MSIESDKTVANFLAFIQHQFGKANLHLTTSKWQDVYMPDKYLLSVIIPARNEFPNIVHTCYSIWHAWEAGGYDPKDIEIIIVNNCSAEWEDPRWSSSKPGDKGTTEYFMARGAYWSRRIQVIYDPIAGNHSARNKGAQVARGKYLFFSDAHMAYKPGFFKNMFHTLRKTGGLFHGAIAWMGAYPTETNEGKTFGVGFGYSIKLGEEIKGTWNNYQVTDKDYFYIPALGHCSVGVERKQFIEFGGYPKFHRCYGGGEFYLNMKWWMFGSTVATHPHAVGFHLASGRGYTYRHDDYIHNVLNIGYALGMDDWLERAYINWSRHSKIDVLEKMMEEAKIEMQEDREFIKKKRKYTFNDLIIKRPWDKKNMKMYGVTNSSLLIFHDTWLDILENAPLHTKELYKNSKHQKGLEEFINNNLSDHVYKRNINK